MKPLLFFILFVFASFDIPAQEYLIIERSGSVKTERIPLYDELTFTLKDDNKGWYTRQILDLDADAQLVLLGDTWIPITEITRIHLKRQRGLANIIGAALQAGGGSMFLGDAYYTVVRDAHQYTEGGMEFGLLNIAAGTGVRALLGPIKYRLGKKTRLRVIDITFRSNDKT